LNSLDIHEIRKYLPHRYPFLLVDRVLDYTKDQSLIAIKNVTVNEPFFPGHFPHHPVMPGVLIVEALAQACAILSLKSQGVMPNEDSIFYFVGINKARFRRPVLPGDQLTLKVALTRRMKGVWQYEGEAYVGEELAASAELMCTYKGI